MRRSPLLCALALAAPLLAAGPCPLTVDHLGVADARNREYSFTDKGLAYWYGRTQAPGTDWFSGWNVATERILSDYQLYVDGRAVDRAQAQVTVYPHRLVRRYDWGEEVFTLCDHRTVWAVEVRLRREAQLAIELVGERLQTKQQETDVRHYTVAGRPDLHVALAEFGSTADRAAAEARASFGRQASTQGFLVALAATPEAAATLVRQARVDYAGWSAARAARMNALLARNVFKSDDPTLDTALAWNLLSLDALVTHQTGDGIYAGLPWFNDYWGRDLFISLPGACLVTGQLDVARRILQSFARYQHQDEHSPFCGRVPNRLRPDDIIYNTTDATPRFVIALADYVRYSGDAALMRELYPAVRRSIEGPLRHWVDTRGYLTHDDADTWMDAKWRDRIPWSPRGNRANDVQALWRDQLRAGVVFAEKMGDTTAAQRWREVLGRLEQHFVHDFIRAGQPCMADRLRADGTPDFTVRPNQLFALDFLPDAVRRAELTRRVWAQLVYPWGVASLSQADANFHPWHEHSTYLHKDEAYHNGTVWLWNNGIAMDRMIEAGNAPLAYALFRHMSERSLESDGAIGALSELTDALPQPGRTVARSSGTFSQAWSSAEYLRVWYQSFVGVRPEASAHAVDLAPRLHGVVRRLDFAVPLFSGLLRGAYAHDGVADSYRYGAEAISGTMELRFDLPPFAVQTVTLQAGETFAVTATPGRLVWKIVTRTAQVREHRECGIDALRLTQAQQLRAVMQGVDFARPRLDPALDCLQPAHKAELQRQLDAVPIRTVP